MAWLIMNWNIDLFCVFCVVFIVFVQPGILPFPKLLCLDTGTPQLGKVLEKQILHPGTPLTDNKEKTNTIQTPTTSIN